jgi:hypothetical protein
MPAWEGAVLAMRVERRVAPLREFVALMLDDVLPLRACVV